MVKTLRRILALACLAAASGAHAQGESLQVLHWWKSASERKAVDLIAARLQEENIGWSDSMIPNGSGVGAGIVLRSRILAKDAPEVAQVNGIVIRDWARLNLLLDLDAVAAAGKWDRLLQPTAAAVIQSDGHVYAAPIGIHRINMLFYNRKLFARVNLPVPETWADFERAAAKLRQAGIVPLAQSSEPWQVTTLFETLVLSEGVRFYRELFERRDAAAYADARLASALKRLRGLKKWMANPVAERPWDETVRDLSDGTAAMMVMGDWAKGELQARGMVLDEGFGCSAVPGTANYHLYNVDTLSMIATRDPHRPAQEKLAALILSPAIQADYNQIKGSIPVLRNPNLAKMDGCARASYKLFASGPEAQVPSLVHRMATEEIVRDAMVSEVHRFFLDDNVTVADAQRRLGTIARTFTKNR
ncbi:ABC transporter substrate-binding protein [Pseudoduganella violacea]|uniref:Probable sugar-binding periplasmic protein n=1 Tax=Pseudoduganella violacea TaxID=1715466 RepID=A0A7W5FTB9_9BURK|nr:ABC transporter substrate-binding protein [Pseudoduganella violacea]MBB3118685.1 glucose/mannose transport system substrate-binding protein [Pseudoduganella violacea]